MNPTDNRSNTGLQKLRQLGHDGIADEIENGLKRWHDRTERHRARRIERDFNGKARLQLNLLARFGDNSVLKECGIWCQFSVRFADAKRNSPFWPCVENNSDSSLSNIISVSGDISDDTSRQHSVFVNSIEFVKLKERMFDVVCPEVVRLKSFDDLPSFWIDTSDLLGLVTCAHWARENGKFRPGLLLWGDARCVVPGQGESQMVEGGPHIEEAIADQDAELFRHWIESKEPEASVLGDEIASLFLRWLGVEFVDKFVWLTFDPRINLRLIGFQMFPCPVELEDEAIRH